MIQHERGFAAIGRARKALLGALVASLVAVPVALAATPRHAEPGQRIDLKVLLVAGSTSDSWAENLKREGIPYDVVVANPAADVVTDDMLADYAGNRAKYEAVIVGASISAHDDAALAKLESTFGIRRLSPYVYPNPAYGMDVPFQSGPQDGVTATLSAAGRQVFPYLKGDVKIADEDKTVDEAWGYQAKPAAGEDFQSLVDGPGGSSYVGVHTRADGRQEMVMTVASNATQSHAQLLRHGMINWVTRGVYLGLQRNYLELHVDDLFLGDDSWDPVTNTTNYDPAAAIRMTAADLDQAAAWSQGDRAAARHGVQRRRQRAVPGCPQRQRPAADRGADAPQRTSGGSTTPGTTRTSTARRGRSSPTRSRATSPGRARTSAPSANARELVTGEHSGLANSRPGNPGTIDPPQFDDVTPTTGGTLPDGPVRLRGLGADRQRRDARVAGDGHGRARAERRPADVADGLPRHRYRVYRATAGSTSWRLRHPDRVGGHHPHRHRRARAATAPSRPPSDLHRRRRRRHAGRAEDGEHRGA